MSIRFPAEWESCEAVWVAWPHRESTWPGHFDKIPAAMVRLIHEIARWVPVRILVGSEHHETCRRLVPPSAAIELIPIETNDCWIRDYGPTFAFQNDSLVGIDWKFNAWGNSAAQPFDLDAAVSRQICDRISVPRVPVKLTLEGGALETDGAGRLLAHAGCLANANRNPGYGRKDLARAMHQLLGIHEIAWIDGDALDGDDTGGHIDQVARFIDGRNVVVATCNDPNDPNALTLRHNRRQLELWASQTTPQVEIHSLPIPPRREIKGQPIPQSYCNFLRIGPRSVLVPTFDSPQSDQHALGLLSELCPNADVVGVDCSELSWGLGAIHCLTCQQPVGSIRK